MVRFNDTCLRIAWIFVGKEVKPVNEWLVADIKTNKVRETLPVIAEAVRLK